MVQNPYATSAGLGALDNSGAVGATHLNLYYRRVKVTNLM